MTELTIVASLLNSLVGIAGKDQAKDIILSEICANLSVKCFRLKEKIKVEEKFLKSEIRKIKKELACPENWQKNKKEINQLCYRATRDYQDRIIDDFSELLLICVRYEFITLSSPNKKRFHELKEQFDSYIRETREQYKSIKEGREFNMSSLDDIDKFYEDSYNKKTESFQKQSLGLIKDLEKEVDKVIEQKTGIWDKILTKLDS